MALLDLFNMKYPSTDFHELNLDWCISAVLQLQKYMEEFTAGNKLIFADPLQHDLTKTYAKNTIVLDDNGNAYISLQPVPKGVQLSNAAYWLMVFNFENYTAKANMNFTDNYLRDTTRAPQAYVIGDWLVLDDVLYKVIAAIAADDLFEVDVNIVHFTIEQFLKDFITTVNDTLYQYSLTIQQYKNDIDASELLYRQQLAQDIATTTANLQAQLDAAIAGVTVDSEVINGRVTYYGKTESTIGVAIRKQTGDISEIISNAAITLSLTFTTTSNYTHDFKYCPLKAGDRVKITTDATCAGGISTRLGDGTVIENLVTLSPNSTQTVTINYDADFCDAYCTVAGSITIEVLNSFRADIEENASDIAAIQSDISEIDLILNALKKINLLDEPASVTPTSRVNPTTGAVEYGYSGWSVYELPVLEGMAYYINRTSDVIAMIWYYDENDDPINSLYNLGLTNWNSGFIVPTGAVKIRLTLTSAYESTAFLGVYFAKWNAGKRTELEPNVIVPKNDYVTVGANGDYKTITQGFAAAIALDTGVIIEPGTYNLVSEGVSGYGLVCPKHVIGYGAKITMILPSEDWDISAFNIPTDKPECIIEGVDIEVTNGRYCIHDEMYSYAGAYHHVIKNCRLKHNSAISEVLLSPRAIGGGIGNAGVVEIYNCYVDSQVTYGDIAYHSNALGSQTDNVYIHVHDNDIEHAIQFSKSGNDDTFCNIAYVSNNRFGLHLPTEGTFTNIQVISWNNVLRS